jgi:SnoaL-like domain
VASAAPPPVRAYSHRVHDAIDAYFEAWNETDVERRRSLLERAITPTAELVDPGGRWIGIEAFSERIDNYLSSAPGTRIVPSSGIDAHHDLVRYSWSVVDRDDRKVMEGLDIAERARDGRLKRISMFHGPLPPTR